MKSDGEKLPGANLGDTSDSDTDVESELDAPLADVLAFVLAARPERVEDALLGLAPREFSNAVRCTRAVITQVTACLEPTPPSTELRARIVDTIGRRLPQRALVVIDMIHDHLDPGTLLEVPRARLVVPALKERIAKARALGIPVIYVVDEHAGDDPDLDAWGTHAVRGTKGTEVWAELAPQSSDWVVKKSSYSAFFGSALADVLDSLDITTLVLAGCLTEIGVLATATDAMQRGYSVEVPRDSQAGSCAEAEQSAIDTIRVMAPFGPARRDRLARLGKLAA